MKTMFLGIFFAGAFLATNALAEITIDTALGDVTLQEKPQSVAAFDIAAIDTLTALGVRIAGAPNNLYVNYLDDVVADAEIVGTLFEPDYEKLAILAPDLIVVGSRTTELRDALSRITQVIDMTISGAGTLDQTRARLAAFGEVFGKQDRASELAAKLDARISMAREVTGGNGTALIVLSNGNRISAFGEETRFGWLHTDLGLPLAATDLEAKTHGQAISFEFIAETDPDWLIVVDRGAAIGEQGAAQAVLDNPIIARTRAAQSGRVVFLSSAPIYIAGGGVISVLTTLDELIAAFGG